jgi:serine phosphatase RsbU (regulator of sigma subunit)
MPPLARNGRLGARVLAALPFLVLAAVAAANAWIGPAYGLLPLLSLGPALAAVLLSPGCTALAGCLAAVICVPLAAYDGLLGSRRMVVALATIAGVTAAGAIASAGRRHRERDLANVKAVADAVQRALLRPVPSRVGGVSMAVRYASANASAQVGGDVYEVISVGGMLRLLVADVQGQGLAAVGTAAVVLGAFREAAYDARGLAEIAARIEVSLQRREESEEFVTAVLAQIPHGGPVIDILSCGHPPPLLLTAAAARFIESADPGLPLGLAQLYASPRRTITLRLGPGERVLFYTDGFSEARDKHGEFYPLELGAALLGGPDLDAALGRLHADVIRHVGHRLRDDAIALMVGHSGEPAHAGTARRPASPRPASQPPPVSAREIA